MYEVEVKVPADHDAVAAALDDAGAECCGAVVQADTYYDAPHRDFASTDEALRLRRERPIDGETDSNGGCGEERTELTYKGPLVDEASKSRREIETRVAEGDRTDELLGALGFEPAAGVTKRRERFRLEGYVVTLDDVEGVGQFVEVEVETDADGVEAARDGAHALLERLGLDPDDQIRRSYLELLLDDYSGE